MNKMSILDKMKLGVSRAGFKIQQHSPEILLVTGVIGMVGGAVAACIATRKLDDVLDGAKADIEDVNGDENAEILTAEEASGERRDIQVKAGMEIVKLYSPAVGLGVFSVVCIFASNGILRKRNAAIAAAYTAVDQAFKQYRERVVNRYGENADYELRYGIKKERIEEEVTDENGKTKKVKKEIGVLDRDEGPWEGYSQYSRIFDSSNPNYEKGEDFNKTFLIQAERFANQKLFAKGYLFLNDVYDMLGFPKTEAGQVVGWIYDPHNSIGDNYVSFGIFDTQKEKARDFVNGYEDVIILDFNVDGAIIDGLTNRGMMGKV